jgi:hypothetical protein
VWISYRHRALDITARVPLKVNAVTSGGTPEARARYDYLSARR